MLIIDRKIHLFKVREIFFAHAPIDVQGCHYVVYSACKNPPGDRTFACEKVSTLIIDLTQDLDAIWSKMDKKSCQYMIKRAGRETIRIKMNENYEEFGRINRNFKKHKGLGTFYSMDRIARLKEGLLLTAEVNGEVVAGQSYLESDTHIRWIIGASKRLEVDKEKAILIGCANRLMTWEAIKYAKDKGIREFDMGGYYTGEDKNDSRFSVNSYKKSFGGVVVDRYTCTKSYSMLWNLAQKLNSFGRALRGLSRS